MLTQATFRWSSEDPNPTRTLTGLIAEGLAEAGFGCTKIEDLDYAYAFRTIVGRRNFFLMIGEVQDGVRQWLVSTKSELGVFGYLMGSRDDDEYQVLTGVIHDVLSQIPNLTDVRWYSLEDYNERPDTHWESSPAGSSQ